MRYELGHGACGVASCFICKGERVLWCGRAKRLAGVSWCNACKAKVMMLLAART